MRGIIFVGDRQLELRDFPDPKPGPREVVVELKASGMCGSDLTPYRQAAGKVMPIIRGHEPCGVVAERGSAVTDDEAPIGQRVMVHHYSGCGQCKYCRVGYAQLCVRGGHLVYGANANGGHAPLIQTRLLLMVPLDHFVVSLVTVGLTCLREQDQRSGVRGLCREQQIQEDERHGIPVRNKRDGVQENPERNHQRLAEDVLRRPEEASDAFGDTTERVLTKRAVTIGRSHAASVRPSADDGAMIRM